MGDGSVTRFELFLTAIVTKFLTKVAKILGKLFELFWKTSFLAETAVTSGVGSKISANYATTTGQTLWYVKEKAEKK